MAFLATGAGYNIFFQMGKSFNETKFCNNSMDFKKAKNDELSTLMGFVYKNSIKCVKPCNTVSYEVSLQKLNKNALLVGGNGIPQVVTSAVNS